MKRIRHDAKSTGNTSYSLLPITLTMRLAILAAVLANLITGCATRPTAPDPIDRLVAKLSYSPPPPGRPFVSLGGWDSGMSSLLVLPAGASTKEIVAEAFGMSVSEPLENFKIIKVRQVYIPNGSANEKPVTAALVDTKAGEKIVLFRYWGPEAGWWNRIYDAN